MTTILETPRIVLRRMTEADAEHLFRLHQSANVMRYIFGEPPFRDLRDALAMLETHVFPQYAMGLGRLACIDRRDGDFLGWCGIKHIADEGEYDLGYRFFEEHWGRGYATEAALACCDFARRSLAGKRVVGKAMHANLGSRRVLEKAGLVLEGESIEEGHALAVYVLPG